MCLGPADVLGEESVLADVGLALGDGGPDLAHRRDIARGRRPASAIPGSRRWWRAQPARRCGDHRPVLARCRSGIRSNTARSVCTGEVMLLSSDSRSPRSSRAAATSSRSRMASMVTRSVSSAGSAESSLASVLRVSSARRARPSGDRSGIRASKPARPMFVAPIGSRAASAARKSSARASTAVAVRAGAVWVMAQNLVPDNGRNQVDRADRTLSTVICTRCRTPAIRCERRAH